MTDTPFRPTPRQMAALENIGHGRYISRAAYWTAGGKPTISHAMMRDLRWHGLVHTWQAPTGPVLAEITKTGRELLAARRARRTTAA